MSGVVLDWLESGLEAAILLPSSEVGADKLSQCYVVDVFPSPQIFYPVLAKLPPMLYLPALMDIITQGYPFNTPGGAEAIGDPPAGWYDNCLWFGGERSCLVQNA